MGSRDEVSRDGLETLQLAHQDLSLAVGMPCVKGHMGKACRGGLMGHRRGMGVAPLFVLDRSWASFL